MEYVKAEPIVKGGRIRRGVGGEFVQALAVSQGRVTAAGGDGETGRGRLDPGMLADMAVLSKDILAIDAEEFLETRVDLTILGGGVVHDRLGELP